MKYLLDTCFLSEGINPEIDPGVREWTQATSIEDRYASVLSLGEIQFGIVTLPFGRKRHQLAEWYDTELRPHLGPRVLDFDEATALAWSELRLEQPNGKIVDMQIAATALFHGLTLVTRNVKDFAFKGISVFNPWRK